MAALPESCPCLAGHTHTNWSLQLHIFPIWDGLSCDHSSSLSSWIKAAEISLLSRFPEATQQEGKALIRQFSLRTAEVGCKSPRDRRSSVFIICTAISLRVIISCIISQLRQETGGDASEEVKRRGSCMACCPAAVVWVSFPPQDLTQASSCPSSQTSPSHTVKEAAAFYPHNHRWQDWVIINGPRAQIPSPPTTAAEIFDKLRSIGAIYHIPDFSSHHNHSHSCIISYERSQELLASLKSYPSVAY